MTRRTAALLARLSEVERSLDMISRSIERIEVATIVREPSSALSVDAYDGLRRQIVAAAQERTAHLRQLAVFAEAAHAQAPQLRPVVEEWLTQAGLVRWADPADSRYYDELGGEGEELRVLRHAFVDEVTGRPVVMGQTERVPRLPVARHAGEHEVRS
jgi:hypothetical protein